MILQPFETMNKTFKITLLLSVKQLHIINFIIYFNVREVMTTHYI